MPAPIQPSVALTIGVGAFVAWRLLSRVRRTIGRQRLASVRPWVSAVLFPLLMLLLLPLALVRPLAALGLLAGCGIGVGLGLYGLRLTRFEATPQGLFYTPSPYVGVALTVLLVARLGWRYAQLYAIDTPPGVAPAYFARSPLTLLVFGMLAGYYATYSIGLLRWKSRTAAAGPAVPGSEP
jgi:hypothetical protein